MAMRNSLATVRSDAIRRTAFQLADSGNYPDWRAIECVLSIRYGVIECRRLLIDLSIRTELNRRCSISLKSESRVRLLFSSAVGCDQSK